MFAAVLAVARGAALADPPARDDEVRGLIALLVDEDQAVRRAASDKLVAIGEAALAPLEGEIRAGRMLPNGQVKITLLKLRSVREERLWNERLAALAKAPRREEFVRMIDGHAMGKVQYEVSVAASSEASPAAAPADRAAPTLTLVVTEPPAGRATEGGATVVTLALDRTLSPTSVQRRPATAAAGASEAPASAVVIAGGRAKGSWSGKAIDQPAPPPLAVDVALPLIAVAMPREVGAELVMTMLATEDLSTSKALSLRCVRAEQRDVDGKPTKVFVYELDGGASGDTAGGGVAAGSEKGTDTQGSPTSGAGRGKSNGRAGAADGAGSKRRDGKDDRPRKDAPGAKNAAESPHRVEVAEDGRILSATWRDGMSLKRAR